MAILTVCSVFDNAVGAFMRPFYTRSRNEAIRSFTDEVNRSAEDNPMHRHPSDYALFHLADFNEDTGAFTEIGERLIRAADATTKA